MDGDLATEGDLSGACGLRLQFDAQQARVAAQPRLPPDRASLRRLRPAHGDQAPRVRRKNTSDMTFSISPSGSPAWPRRMEDGFRAVAAPCRGPARVLCG